MFSVDEATAAAIRRAYEDGGELAGIVEFKRHFPLISDHAKARECARIIAGWQPLPDQPAAVQGRRRSKPVGQYEGAGAEAGPARRGDQAWARSEVVDADLSD